jgi:hypothetical protein
MIWGDRDALKDEVANLKMVREGPNIVQLYEAFFEKEFCYLVLEIMAGGELFDRIIEKETFSEKEARDSMRCVLGALEYMHDRRVAHRDLKPENLLLAVRIIGGGCVCVCVSRPVGLTYITFLSHSLNHTARGLVVTRQIGRLWLCQVSPGKKCLPHNVRNTRVLGTGNLGTMARLRYKVRYLVHWGHFIFIIGRIPSF